MDHASPPGADGERPIELFLYARPGCELCDETRVTLQALLARRASKGQWTPTLVERDIEADPALERAFFAEIPVVELGERRMTLAISPARIEQLIADVLDR